MKTLTIRVSGDRLQQLIGFGIKHVKERLERATARMRLAEAKIKAGAEYPEAGGYNSPQRGLFEAQLEHDEITHQLVVIEWFVVQVSSGDHFELSLADIDAVSHGSFSSLTRTRDVQ